MLQSNNVVLRRLEAADQAALARLANNKKIWDQLRDYIPFPYSSQHAADFIALTRQEPVPMTFGIEARGCLSGVVGLVGLSDVYRKTAEIGYWIGEPFWNQGLASAAVGLATHHAVQHLGFTRVHAGVFAYNVASMRVLLKNGYVREGIFQKAVFKNEQVWDEHRFAFVK
ncbi:GNAT family N-acetyltransferase [Hymenobacter negativus]|uniref:GNAT family N-acetyltransferase n=1 Tax=Hymenobacter negativus TaxID=2795026 RepID=A0ABS3QJH4_9BACT|nr:GNAT family protein [Hymenobacter negativus]MBO2010855.1 GNAT family N-acetyltransferase [Hymenobacter negativus]